MACLEQLEPPALCRRAATSEAPVILTSSETLCQAVFFYSSTSPPLKKKKRPSPAVYFNRNETKGATTTTSSFEFSCHSRAGAARKPSVAGESISTRQLSERLGNARVDAGLRHPTEALCRRRRRRLQSAVQRAHKHQRTHACTHATCTGGSVPMATPVIDPP